MFAMFMAAAPAGILVDRIGPTPLLAVGNIGIVLAVFMTSLCHEYYQFFLAQALLMGLSMGFVTIPSMAAVTKHFTKHRGIASGFTIAGSSLGGIIWPIMLDQLLNKHGISFGSTVRIVGYTMIPIGLLSTTLVRLPEKEEVKSAEDLEISSDPGDKQQKPKKKADFSVIRKPAFIMMVAGVMIFNLAMFSPFFFVTSYAISLGHSTSFAFYLLSALNGASLFGRIGLGSIADVYGPFNLLSIAAVISAAVCFCWTAATSIAGLIIWCLAYGFTCGACLSLQLQCATALSTPESHGTVMGLAFGGVSVTGLVGNPIAGALVPKGWVALSMYAGSSLMAGAVLVVLSRLSLSRELRVKV